MLIFDFDGVLLNSLDEVLVTGHYAVTGDPVMSLEALPADLIDLFRQNRYHFQTIGDAIPLMNWCLANYGIALGRLLTKAEYQAIIQKAEGPLIERTQRFFAFRKQLLEKDRETWLALNMPYQPLWDELVKRGGERVVLLTNKNREATLCLCRHFRLTVLEENIYSGDEGVTKVQNLNRIRDRFGDVPYAFIDDSVNNLRQVDVHFNKEKTLLSLLFAKWGYSGRKEVLTARTYGYPVLEQADLIAMLDGALR